MDWPYDGVVDTIDAAIAGATTEKPGFGKRRKITAEERDELKRKCDEMADECVARNKRGIACEEERRRCKRRVYARWFYAPTFHERLDHFLYTADERAERAERTEKAKEARNKRLREREAREKREAREESEAKKAASEAERRASEAKKEASEAKRETIRWAGELRRAREERSNASSQAKRTGRPERPEGPERPERTEGPEGPERTDEKRTERPGRPVNTNEEKRALRMLKLFLERAGANMGTIDVKLLTELEREFMPTVRARVPSARLVGVPDGICDEWPTYVYLYCMYLVAVGALGTESKDRGVTTLFVSVPGPDGPGGPSGPKGPNGLRVCLLRFDREGRLSISY